ncbi:MAG: ATP-binding protein [Clostridia bacterium]|nr:ATP-binding protein [Clostridia bacterium]
MKEIKLTAKVENLPKLMAFIDAELEAVDCSMKAQMQIDVAVDELFANIASYAYAPGTGQAAIRFDYDKASRTVTIAFWDSGVPFDPLAKADPDVNATAEEREAGGLGIFLVKKTMDHVEYRYTNGSNVLTIQKQI